MVQAQWEKHGLNCVSCCEGDDGCHPYPPCCIRDVLFLWAALISTGSSSGPLSTARIERMTIKNKAKSLTSVDWSTWNFIDSVGAGGSDQMTFGARSKSGCDFGIDISLEDWFCGTELDQWHVEVTVCNPQDETIYVQPDHGKVSLCISFEDIGLSSCCAVLQTTEQPTATAISSGDSYTFLLDFSPANYTDAGCKATCWTPGPDIIVKGSSFLTDAFSSTCLRPVYCLSDAQNTAPADPTTTDCAASECPVCGCYHDDDGGCTCSCDGDEAMGSCAPPKKVLSGCSDQSGMIQLCHEKTIGPGIRVVEGWNSDCEQTFQVTFDNATDTWNFVVRSAGALGTDGGAAVTKPLVDLPDCGFYTVRWSHTGAGGTANLTVDGTGPFSQNMPAGFVRVLPVGTCYALAEPGNAFTAR